MLSLYFVSSFLFICIILASCILSFKYYKIIERNNFYLLNLFLINQFIAKILRELASNSNKTKALINNIKFVEDFLDIEVRIIDLLNSHNIFPKNPQHDQKLKELGSKNHDIKTNINFFFSDKNVIYIDQLQNNSKDKIKATLVILENSEFLLEDFYKQYAIETAANVILLGYRLILV